MSFHPSSILPAVQHGVDQSAYHKLGNEFARGDARRTMSRGQLWEFRECPSRWVHKKDNDKSTRLMDWGSLMDVVFMTSEQLGSMVAIMPATYHTNRMVCPQCGSATDSKKCAKCKCDRVETPVELEWNLKSDHCSQWKEDREKEGKLVVSEATISDAWTARKRLENDEEIADLYSCCQKQVQLNIEWADPETGLVIPVKCLLDLVPDPASTWGDSIWDFKTTNDAATKPWRKRIHNDGLFYQAAFYLDAMNAAKNLKYRNFGHVVQESSQPYECTIRPLELEWLDAGRICYKKDLDEYCRSIKTRKFRGLERNPVGYDAWMLEDYQ